MSMITTNWKSARFFTLLLLLLLFAIFQRQQTCWYVSSVWKDARESEAAPTDCHVTRVVRSTCWKIHISAWHREWEVLSLKTMYADRVVYPCGNLAKLLTTHYNVCSGKQVVFATEFWMNSKSDKNGSSQPKRCLYIVSQLHRMWETAQTENKIAWIVFNSFSLRFTVQPSTTHVRTNCIFQNSYVTEESP